jgi:hypothetical protein
MLVAADLRGMVELEPPRGDSGGPPDNGRVALLVRRDMLLEKER